MVSQEELNRLRKELVKAKEEKRKRDICRENVGEIKLIGKESKAEAQRLRRQIFEIRQERKIVVAKKIGRGFKAFGRGAVSVGRTTSKIAGGLAAQQREREKRRRRLKPKRIKQTTFAQDIDSILKM